MSSIDRTVYSPGHEGRIYESTANASRWTIDTLENRYTRISSARRSILKGSQTPLRYNSPLFQYEREKKRARLVQRRVSFAPDAQIRMFMEGDSPDLSNRSVPNLIEETEPTIMMNNAFGSPFFEHQQSPLLNELFESPSERRKRRPDLFGSPTPRSSFIKSSATRNLTMSSQRRIDEQRSNSLDETSDENNQETDLTEYLSNKYQNGPINIFDDEDDEDEDIKNTTIPEGDKREDKKIKEVESKEIDFQPAEKEKHDVDLVSVKQDIVIENQLMDEEEESTDSMLITQTIDETSLLSMSPPVSPLLVETNKYDQNQRMNSLNIEDRIRNDIEDTKELEESKSIGGEDSMQITQEMSNQNMIFQHEQVLQDENEDLQSVYLSPIPETHINTEPDQTIFSSGKDEDIVQEELSKIHESAIETLMNEVNENNIPLSDFLSYVGISFPEEVPIKSLRRRSGYDINYEEPATILEQTIAAASILPQVEVFQLACKQLTTLIENCKQKIQDLREDINKRNLKLFHEYAEGEIPFRSEIELGLSSYKAYARLQALCDSYHRWVTILEELRSTLKTNQEKLLENEQLITKAEEHIKEKLQDTEAYKIELQKIVDEAHSKEREYNLTDHQQLEKLENEIDQQKHSIQAFTEKAEKLEKDDIELSEKIVSLEKNKTELQEIIEKAEDIIAKNKVITLKELADASQAFNRCSKLYSWKFEKIKEDFVKVCINQDISIIIDDKKLKNKVDNAILIHTRDDLEEDFGPLVKLLHGLKTIIKDKWDINEITQDISIYWNRIKMIQYELRIIQRRFWVEIHSLDNNQLEGAGFSCKICVFNNEKQVKFTISFNIEPNDILYYPDINLSSFDLYLHHGEISYEQLRTLVVEGISETGFETLADTIENVLTQIPIP